MVDVVRNTSTTAFSFGSSCHQDVLSSSINSSIPDVQDVTEPTRHELIVKVNVVNDRITSHNIDNDTDAFREIMSMTKTREVDKSTLMFLEGNVNGYNARILIDCGASHNFISEGFIKCHDLKTNNITRVSVTVANGIKSSIDQALVDFELKLDKFNNKITSAYVFPITSDANYDLILGLPWLSKNNPHIDLKTRIITINANHQKYLLKTTNSNKQIINNKVVDTIECADNFLINAKQLSRCKQIYLVTIKMTSNCYIDTVTSMDKQINQLLEEFSDVFL